MTGVQTCALPIYATEREARVLSGLSSSPDIGGIGCIGAVQGVGVLSANARMPLEIWINSRGAMALTDALINT